MGGITERKYESGTVVYRARIRRRGFPDFNLTFDEREAASDWLEENEKEYLKDPDKFFKWRDEIYSGLRRSGEQILQNIIKPKFRLRPKSF